MDATEPNLDAIHQVNHPLIGQRIALREGWIQQGRTFRIRGVLDDGVDTVVTFDLNEHAPSTRQIAGLAYVSGPGYDRGTFTADVVRTIFGSRSRNVDPLPYVDGHRDSAGNARRFAEPYHLDGDGTDCQWCVTTYSPRPEYDPAPIHQVNPILAELRAQWTGEWRSEHALFDDANGQAWERAGEPYDGPGSQWADFEQHAWRVIERLAAL